MVMTALAMIATVNTAIGKVSTALSKLGTGSKALDMHLTFINKLQDSIDAGVGNLVDADLAKESAKIQSLQTRQQLGVQAFISQCRCHVLEVVERGAAREVRARAAALAPPQDERVEAGGHARERDDPVAADGQLEHVARAVAVGRTAVLAQPRSKLLRADHRWLVDFKGWFRSVQKPLKIHFEDQLFDCDNYANCFVAFADLLGLHSYYFHAAQEEFVTPSRVFSSSSI